MSETPLKNQIIAWLKNFDYWFQYAGNKLLEGETITDELATTTYVLFKEDCGLKEKEEEREEVNYSEMADSSEVESEPLELKLIKDIENVNALATEQSIVINPNLTIVYGGNGTGKSGYIRLLNNAFSSRGDKQILHNVFKSIISGEPCCKFTFQSDTSKIELEYPNDKDNTVFTQFSVFDSHSVRVLLEQDNKLNFTPTGFEFFEKVLLLYRALTTKFQEEISANRPNNEFEKHFINENPIQTEIANLGATTDIKKLKELGNYTEADEEKLTKLLEKWKDLKSLDIPKKISELQKLQGQLTEFTTRQQAILDLLKPEDIEIYKSLITSYHKLRDLAKQEGITSLKEYEIEALGSNEWRDFIKASKSYATVITENRENGTEYPDEIDNCLFCLQPLTDKQNTLIKSYWKLLKSEAAAELNRIIQKIQEAEKKLKGLSPAKFDETTTLFDYVNMIDEPLAMKWNDLVAASETVRQNLIINLSQVKLELPISSFTDNTKDFNKIDKQIKDTIEELIKKNPVKDLEVLEAQINCWIKF